MSRSDITAVDQIAASPAPKSGLPLPRIPFDLSLMALALCRREAGDGDALGVLAGSGSGTAASHYDVVVSPKRTNNDFNGLKG